MFLLTHNGILWRQLFRLNESYDNRDTSVAYKLAFRLKTNKQTGDSGNLNANCFTGCIAVWVVSGVETWNYRVVSVVGPVSSCTNSWVGDWVRAPSITWVVVFINRNLSCCWECSEECCRCWGLGWSIFSIVLAQSEQNQTKENENLNFWRRDEFEVFLWVASINLRLTTSS